ncbi:MAG: hypothetical protein A2Y33_00195 [Spirochaetes bacterium GWF1_51_8]|nr:MAG: hypothetical protein A2Y33_00195 [Spirochaetes bacterium GWF1_51_8]
MKKYFSVLLTALFILGVTSCGGNDAAVKKPSPAKPALLLEGPFKIPAFKSKYLSPAPQAEIYLPSGYSTNGAGYPVLYMHDGQNLGNWKIKENVSALVEKGLIPPIIVVGIYHRGNMRIYDYSPTYISSNIGFGDLSGGLTNYGKFIAEELKPYIDSHYNTLTNRESTAVMGSSMGGLASYNLLGWYPGVFGKAGCLSPILRWNVFVGEKLNKSLVFPKDVKIYIDGGWMETVERWEMIASMRKTKEWLIGKGFKEGVQFYYYESPKGIHNESDWASRLYMPLLYFFGGYASGVKSVKLVSNPAKTGIGDISTIIPEAELSNGMKLTPIPGAFKSSDPKSLSIDGWGQVKGLKAGEVTVSYEYQGISAQIKINVLPKSRDAKSVKLTIKTSAAVSGIKIKVLTFNGAPDKTVLVPSKNAVGDWEIEIEKLKSDYLTFEVVDQDGKKGYDSKGEAILKKIIFSANTHSELNVAEWK